MNGSLSIEVDHLNGFVTIVGVGMWSPERTETHFRDLERAILKIRREHGKVRVFVDLRGASVQTAETAAVMNIWTRRIYRACDRVAVVCATALLAMQIKRSAEVDVLATFHEIEPARRWMHAG